MEVNDRKVGWASGMCEVSSWAASHLGVLLVSSLKLPLSSINSYWNEIPTNKVLSDDEQWSAHASVAKGCHSCVRMKDAKYSFHLKRAIVVF